MTTSYQLIYDLYAKLAIEKQQHFETDRRCKEQIQKYEDQIADMEEKKYEMETEIESLKRDLQNARDECDKAEKIIRSQAELSTETQKKFDQCQAQKLSLKADMENMKRYYEREKERLVDDRLKGLLQERQQLLQRNQLLEEVANKQDVENMLQVQEADGEIRKLKEETEQKDQEISQLKEQLSQYTTTQSDQQTFQQTMGSFAQQLKQQQEAQRIAYQQQAEAARKQQEQITQFRQKQMEDQMVKQQVQMSQQQMLQDQVAQQLASDAPPAAMNKFLSFTAAQQPSTILNCIGAVEEMEKIQTKAGDLSLKMKEHDRHITKLEKLIQSAMEAVERCLKEKAANTYVPTAQIEELNRQQTQLRGEIYKIQVLQQKDAKRADAAEQMVSELEQQISALEQELLFYHTGNGGYANRREAKHKALFDTMAGMKNVTLIGGMKK